MSQQVQMKNMLRLKRALMPLKEADMCHVIKDPQLIQDFMKPRNKDPPRSIDPLEQTFHPSPTTSPSSTTTQIDDTKILSHHCISASVIKAEIKKRIEDELFVVRSCKKGIPQVAAVVHYLLAMILKSVSTQKSTLKFRQLEAYRNFFPPGTHGFTIPPSDKSKPPDNNYALIEGKTIYILNWELNFPNVSLECPCEGCSGKMIQKKFDFTIEGKVTPIQTMSGSLDYAVSMQYFCGICKSSFKANDGRLFGQLPSHVRSGYPVEPRFALSAEHHLDISSSRFLQSTMLTYGNGNIISRHFYELMAKHHEDMNEVYYDQAIDTETHIQKPLPDFHEFNRKSFLRGDAIRIRYDKAASSSLTTCNISDYDRYTREIQGVGCATISASDHTFATVKNYRSTDVEGAKCVFTVNSSDSGEVAGMYLVNSTEAKQYSHALEQFASRPNVDPKIHVTDDWPSNADLIESIFNERGSANLKGRLGLFHFIQRLTKTLNENHPDCRKAMAALSRCVYREDEGDVEKVLEALKHGRINGTFYSNEDANKIRATKQWRNYRKYIRTWTRPATLIQENIDKWFDTFQAVDRDPKSNLPLCLWNTASAVRNAKMSAKFVTDLLPANELFIPIGKTDYGLTIWQGIRGAESKLESFHLALNHFANRGCKRSLADNLTLHGVALYNLRIRFRKRLTHDTKLKESLMSFFLNSPAHLNNSHLLAINNKANRAGLRGSVYGGIEILPEDNGERFMSEYWEQQNKRNQVIHNKILIDAHLTGRCLCILCAGQINIYLDTMQKRFRQQRSRSGLQGNKKSGASAEKLLTVKSLETPSPHTPMKTENGNLVVQPAIAVPHQFASAQMLPNQGLSAPVPMPMNPQMLQLAYWQGIMGMTQRPVVSQIPFPQPLLLSQQLLQVPGRQQYYCCASAANWSRQ
jgi:hypothetical protein